MTEKKEYIIYYTEKKKLVTKTNRKKKKILGKFKQKTFSNFFDKAETSHHSSWMKSANKF